MATNGNDKNPGTISEPVLSLQNALLISRKTKANQIIIKGGDYYNVNVTLEAQDSGLSIRSFDSSRVRLYAGSVLKADKVLQNGWLEFDIPESKDKSWDFRMILINGNLRERAHIPQIGSFIYLNKWVVKGLSASDGYWERKPSFEELNVLKYSSTDFGAIDINNAEITIKHQWEESYLGIKEQDKENNSFTFIYPASFPLGSFSKERNNAYTIWNTESGMQKKGQWYLNRSVGKLFYWPNAGETKNNVTAIVPRFSSIIEMKSGVKNITISDLSLLCGTNKLQNEGFAGREIDALISGNNVEGISITNLKIERTTGSGIKFYGREIKISNCTLTNIGGGGIFLSGNGNNEVTNTSISHVGTIFKSSVGILAGKKTRINRASISDIPYSGIIVNGDSTTVENCSIEGVMQFLNDGAAVYASSHRNVVFNSNHIIGDDNMKIGIYYDEKSSDCVATNNMVINTSTPIHCHIASDITFTGNIFYNYDSQTISCQRSDNIKIDNNTFICKKIIFVDHDLQFNKKGLISFSRNKLIGLEGDNINNFRSSLPIVVDDMKVDQRIQIDFRRTISVKDVTKMLRKIK
ncbi:right-handed parallel beta-helix repeat-containing protein [Dyadobacter subterraneus]|uniref:Right-handed parallel beta-helix repeat-containing protein n=1 Tax=Dyadobacter subterraneus TaxID=2773304 RepID=A0ABR9WRA2_9BACT|nr:right-handed parallel beta-helix repeat-containing protein [Dyadobacter subterraneus]MBE9466624.1 right-handed parallel beta-helix repeat-containing protein [Dyadobacter subterraneus]